MCVCLFPSFSALIFSSNNGHLEAVRVLLQNRADIEARSNDGRTSLLWAAHWGHYPVVQYLVQRGAFIDAVDSGTIGFACSSEFA